MSLRRRQRGVALLVALLVVALSVMLVASLLSRGELALARTRNLLREVQASAWAQGMELYAAEVLLAARPPDTAGSAWAMPLPPQEVPGGVVHGRVLDASGCLNLNNLAPSQPMAGLWKAAFERLLEQHGLDPAIAGAVQQWLDAPHASSAAPYQRARPPYRPRSGPMVDASELQLVAGIDARAFSRLAAHVCALPAGFRLNVNAATPAVLRSLVPGLTEAQAQRLWNGGRAHFASSHEFAAATGLEGAVPLPVLDVASSHFLLQSQASLDGVVLRQESLIERVPGRPLRVLRRSRPGPAPVVTE